MFLSAGDLEAFWKKSWGFKDFWGSGAAGGNFEGFEDEIRWKHAKNSKFHLHFDQESIFGALDPQDIIINSIDQP